MENPTENKLRSFCPSDIPQLMYWVLHIVLLILGSGMAKKCTLSSRLALLVVFFLSPSPFKQMPRRLAKILRNYKS